MSGPVRPPLEVTEVDGVPDGRPINKIIVSNGDLSISGTTATIDTSGAGGTAALTDTYVGFGSGSNLLTGSANFTFTEDTGSGPVLNLQGENPRFNVTDDTTGGSAPYYTQISQSGASLYFVAKDAGTTNNEIMRMASTWVGIQRNMTPNVGIGTVPDTGTALHISGSSVTSTLIVESTADSASSAPDIKFYHNRGSGNAADGDYLAHITFTGLNDADEETIYYQQFGRAKTVSDGSEDGEIFHELMLGGTLRDFFRMQSVSGSGYVVFNEEAQNLDFRIETSGNENMLKVDGGNNAVGVGCNPDSSVQLEVKNDVAPGSASIVRISNSNASMPSDTKYGAIEFYNADGSGAGIGAEIRALSNGSGRGGQLDLLVGNSGGGQTSKVFIDETGVVTITDTASSTATTDVEKLHVKGDGGTGTLVRFESTDNDTDVGPVLDMRRTNADATGTDGDNLGEITFNGLDDGGGVELFTRIRATAADTHSTLAEGALEILNLYNGAEVNALRIGPIGDAGSSNNAVDVNPDSAATCDFRVRGDGVSNLFYVDVSSDKIGIGEFPNSGGSQLQIDEDISCLRPYVTNNSATHTLTDAQCHNKVVHLTYDTAAQVITMPTAVSGMCVTLVRQQASNAPEIKAAASEKINSVTSPSKVTMGAQYSVIILHGITGTGWIAYEPAVAS